jgi:hypothetical protein
MVSISGIFYIVIGLAVSVASFIINRSAKSNSLVLFLYIGVVFIIIGVLKLIFSRKAKPARQPGQQAAPLHHPPVSPQHHPPHASNQSPPPGISGHSSPQQPTPFVQTPVANLYQPPNKVEQLVLEQEKKQAEQPAASGHPPIVHCPHCGRRQYATRPTCFSCKRPL